MLHVSHVDALTAFQALIWRLANEYRRRGYTSRQVTVDETLRMMSTVPVIRDLRDRSGWRWEIPHDEAQRITDVVRGQMHFLERPLFVFNDNLYLPPAPVAHKRDGA